jgi:DNA replication and repair protein RecF
MGRYPEICELLDRGEDCPCDGSLEKYSRLLDLLSSKNGQVRYVRIFLVLLERIEALNFRNLAGSMSFASGLNFFLGNNGEGKTNWLEAINLLASTRSFRTARLQEAIRFGESLAVVRGSVRESPELSRELQVAIEGTSKLLTVNGKKETTARYLGQLHAVVFNSDTLEIVRGQPEARRRFLDEGIVSLHPPFVQTFSDYNRVIRQKNALLQQARDEEMPLDRVTEALTPWNEQIASLSARIHRGRVRFVARLKEVLEQKLFGDEEVMIRYRSSLEGKGDLSRYEALIEERLRVRVQAEVVAGHSLIGAHRDELEILLDGRDIRRFGSAGQQRSALFLLLLASIEVYRSTRGEYPLFLLDDIDAELDYERIEQSLEYLKDKTQTFATTSKEGLVEKFGQNARVFVIQNGIAKMQ